jgi:hypothetical protein
LGLVFGGDASNPLNPAVEAIAPGFEPKASALAGEEPANEPAACAVPSMNGIVVTAAVLSATVNGYDGANAKGDAIAHSIRDGLLPDTAAAIYNQWSGQCETDGKASQNFRRQPVRTRRIVHELKSVTLKAKAWPRVNQVHRLKCMRCPVSKLSAMSWH